MAIPDYQSLMLPVLQTLTGGGEVSIAQTRKRVAAGLNLSDEDLAERLPSGGQSTFANRVGWAVTHLTFAGLIKKIRRGVNQLTEEGEQLLASRPERIDNKLLESYPAYVKRRQGWTQPPNGGNGPTPPDPVLTPEERLERDHQLLEESLESQVLDRVRDASPAFFERVVVDLMVSMGYGGGRPEMGEVMGTSRRWGDRRNDSGRRASLDEVYVQAKRYAEGNTIGRTACETLRAHWTPPVLSREFSSPLQPLPPRHETTLPAVQNGSC